MKPIPFLAAFAAFAVAWLIPPGTAQAHEATFDLYYWSYEEQVTGDDDFVDEYSDPVFASLGLRHWETRPDTIRALYTAEIGAGPSPRDSTR